MILFDNDFTYISLSNITAFFIIFYIPFDIIKDIKKILQEKYEYIY